MCEDLFVEVSSKIDDLFEKIVERDGQCIAEDVFNMHVDETIEYAAEPLLMLNFYKDNKEFYVYFDDYLAYFFLRNQSQTKLYNKLLRTWCEKTDRKIKKSTKKEKLSKKAILATEKFSKKK